MIKLVLWCFGNIFLFLPRTVNSEVFSEKWALAQPESIANWDLLFKPWKVGHDSWTLGTQAPGILHCPVFQKAQAWPVSQWSNTAQPAKQPTGGVAPPTQLMGCIAQLPCLRSWGWDKPALPDFFISLPSWSTHSSASLVQGTTYYLWVSAGLISLQYRVYAYYCRSASENITVYNDFPQENQNQNNNERE